MKKIVLTLALLSSACVLLLFADTAPAPSASPTYISPNNDGVKDNLVFPVRISDKRYISEWRLYITDASGKALRTIENKENRPKSLNFAEFWRIISTPKQSVDVPKTIIWDGTFDGGETAPDGHYFYYMTVKDDNGNESVSAKYEVVVKCAPPSIDLTQPSSADKFFGEGAKATLHLRQTGSVEDKWTAAITDTAGKTVRAWTIADSAPVELVWDGRDNDGALVADGTYAYSIEATDRAGNKSPPARIANIMYSGDKPVAGIAISGSNYFSPETESDQKTITLVPTIPAPTTGNSLQSWKIDIVDQRNAIKKSYSGNGSAPASIVFDGRDESGAPLSDGAYQAQVIASYLNGYETPDKRSPVFNLDRSKPTATINLKDTVFSPDGNGDKDTIAFTQKLSTEETAWRGEIVNNSGIVVRRFDLGGKPATELAWNGLNDAGSLCPDGSYNYRVSCTDLAGNSAAITSAVFNLDTSKAELMISVSPEAFSPNGDSVQDTVRFAPRVTAANSGVDRWTLAISESKAKTPLRVISGEGAPPAQIVWDGKKDDASIADDGIYNALFTVVQRNGTPSNVSSQLFTLDTIAPSATITPAYTLFSPDGDTYKDILPLTIKTTSEKLWTGSITREGGNATAAGRNFVWYNADAKSFDWDGADNSGNVLADGSYVFTLSATDAAGNKGSASLSGITIDNRPTRAWVTTLNETIAPKGNKTKIENLVITTSIKADVESWSFEIINTEDPKEKPVKTWADSGNTIPAALEWDGKKEDGSIAEGIFSGALKIIYAKGNHVETESPAFVCTGKAPDLKVTIKPEYFSPDNDGVDDECLIALSAESLLPFSSWTFEVFDTQDPQSTQKAPGNKPFWTVKGKSPITNQLVWNGKSNKQELVQSAMDYPYTFTVTDAEGQTSSTSGIIKVDVLVILVDGKLKIQVPSIIFRADNADFGSKKQYPSNGLEQSIIDNNNHVLDRIARILNKFKDYKVVIEGHAHNVSGSETEETSTAGGNIPLIKLSKERAEFVKKELVKRLVLGGRLSPEGMGGTKPIADKDDRDNWWKDRRVEFILDKDK